MVEIVNQLFPFGSKDGYPGNPNYREFHRDLGWDLSIENLKNRDKEKRPLGIKLFKISSKNTSLATNKNMTQKLQKKALKKTPKII